MHIRAVITPQYSVVRFIRFAIRRGRKRNRKNKIKFFGEGIISKIMRKRICCWSIGSVNCGFSFMLPRAERELVIPRMNLNSTRLRFDFEPEGD